METLETNEWQASGPKEPTLAKKCPNIIVIILQLFLLYPILYYIVSAALIEYTYIYIYNNQTKDKWSEFQEYIAETCQVLLQLMFWRIHGMNSSTLEYIPGFPRPQTWKIFFVTIHSPDIKNNCESKISSVSLIWPQCRSWRLRWGTRGRLGRCSDPSNHSEALVSAEVDRRSLPENYNDRS